MCDKAAFDRVRDSIIDLQKADAIQSEQIRMLFRTTETQGERQDKLTNRLVVAVLGVLALTVLALVWGALGERGFNGVTKAAHHTAVMAPN